MTLTFITNYLTHHTSPLSEALYGWLGAGFRFVETRPLRAGQVELGWQPEQDRPYLLRAYQGPEVAARCRHLALGSDGAPGQRPGQLDSAPAASKPADLPVRGAVV